MDAHRVAAQQEARHIEDVRRLFDVLTAGLFSDAPPRGSGHPAHPVAARAEHFVIEQFFARRLNGVAVTPVVADARQRIRLDHRVADFQGDVDIRVNRLFDEQGDALFDARQFRLAVRERRHADVHGVEVFLLVHLLETGVRRAAELFRPGFGAVFRYVAHRGELHVVKAL